MLGQVAALNVRALTSAKTVLAALAYVTVSLSPGCVYKRVPTSELPGEYRVSLPDGGSETLRLLPSGECSQVIQLKNGQVYSANGIWEYDEARRRILFRGLRETMTATHELNPNIASIPPGVWGTDVLRSVFGNPLIYFNEGRYYSKRR
jgi:hypothetical protein